MNHEQASGERIRTQTAREPRVFEPIRCHGCAQASVEGKIFAEFTQEVTMSWLVQYRTLARYNQWMNDNLYRCAAALSDEARKQDRGAFFGSIHGTLNHLLLGDCIWMTRFTGDSRHLPRDARGERIQISGLAHELYADFAELTQRRMALDTEILAFTEALDEATLARPLRYTTSRGEVQQHALWPALTHFFNHQTHHRGQISTLLMQAGVDLGVTDLIAYARTIGVA